MNGEQKKYTTCPNCGKLITCGCQVRKSLNGTPCCSRCVRALDLQVIKERKTEKPKRRYL